MVICESIINERAVAMGACDWGWIDTRSICLLHYLVFSKSVVVIRVSLNIWIHETELILVVELKRN